MHARTAGWTVIKGKGRIRTASQNHAALLDARGFAKMLAAELKSSQIHRKSFAVLLLQLHRHERHGADPISRLAEIMDGNGTHRSAAARLGPNQLGIMLRAVDAKSAALVSQELSLRLQILGFDPIEVDGGIFPDDAEMLRGLRRTLAR